MFRILMVCMGNICRSPLAEAVARAMAEERGMSGRLEFDSAGTHAYHAGEAPDERARHVAAQRGYTLAGLKARKVVDADFERFDLILAMDRQNLAALKERCPEAQHPKLHLLLAYAGIAAEGEVPDPYYGNRAGFERVLDLCETAAQGLLRRL